jgi:ADP-ribose pyrophosphatase
MIGAGEAPDEVARRETLEETGLQITELRPILSYYASPGGLTEHIDLFCGRVSAAIAGGVHGLADEAEDIRVVAAGFEEAMAKLDSGLIVVSPAVIALQWLALNRNRLRTDWT